MRPPLRLLLIAGPVIASTQIRCILPFDYLAEAGAVEWRLASLADFTAQDIDWPDVVVFSRIATPAAAALLRVFQRLGIPVVYDFDDDFLNIEDPDNEKLFSYYRRPEIRRAIEDMLRGADRLVVSTDRLAQIARHYNPRVKPIENSVDLALLAGAEPAEARKERVIGYAGTPHRERDFLFVTPALERLLANHRGRIRLHFMGFVPEALKGRPEVEFEPFQSDYPSFIRRLAASGWSLGLAPLEGRGARLAKSDIKFLEYAACRIAGVYSDVLPYHGVDDGRLGLRAANQPDSWHDAILRLLSDRDLRQRVTAAAFDHVSANCEVSRAAGRWLDLLLELRKVSNTSRLGAPSEAGVRRDLARFEALRRNGAGNRQPLTRSVKRWLRASPRLYHLLKSIDRRLSRQAHRGHQQ